MRFRTQWLKNGSWWTLIIFPCLHFKRLCVDTRFPDEGRTQVTSFIRNFCVILVLTGTRIYQDWFVLILWYLNHSTLMLKKVCLWDGSLYSIVSESYSKCVPAVQNWKGSYEHVSIGFLLGNIIGLHQCGKIHNFFWVCVKIRILQWIFLKSLEALKWLQAYEIHKKVFFSVSSSIVL